MTATRAGLLVLAAMTIIGLLAPLLASERPLALRSEQGMEFPALRNLLSPLPRTYPPETTRDATWKLAAPVPYHPLAIDLDARLEPPGAGHWLGTDELGRDILSRLIHATRPSLMVALLATLVSLGLGIPIGATAGYAGGRTDLALSRVIEASLSFPVLILLLLLTAFALGGSTSGEHDKGAIGSVLVVGLAVGVARWGVIARYMRGEVLRLARTDLAVAARSAGASPYRIVSRHLIPTGFGPVAISAAFGAGSAVVAEASLSFLGMGVQPPAPTWGQMIAVAADMGGRYWWMLLFPGGMIAVTVAAFNLVAEGLRSHAGS